MNDSEQRGVEASVMRLWAKTNSTTAQWHPLLYHLVETSAVASLLWDEILAPSTCKVVANALGLRLDQARQWSLFLVGSHDLGKASPSFQCKWEQSVIPLKQLGYRFPQPKTVMPIPHGRVSSIELARILQKRGVERKVAKEIARAVGGHHGIFDTASALQQASPQAVGEGLWEDSRTWIVDWLAKQHDLAGLPTKHELAGLTLLAGLTTVSDWIASSEEHFPYRPERLGTRDGLDILMAEAKRKARAALDRLGWRARLRLPEPLDFQTFFGINPRPLQIASIRISGDLTLPSLVIVEAPMGEGKTEAALFVAERLKQRHELRGSYIALPTQATSNQMFGRVVKALSDGESEGIAHILLLHGHASLSAEFSELKRKGETGFLPSSVDSDGRDGAPEAQAMAAEWFTHRKRGLLAPYGVGTIDQVLMAALQSKHVFVRLLGLAGKVVVIDEVHAYDTYMSALLERLLAWLRAIGTSVVMLSATLPSLRRAALVKAFAPEGQVSADIPAYPCLTVVSGSEVRTIAFAAAAPGKRIRLEAAPPEPTALAVWIRDRICGGGCAAVVCNTVARAQEIYEECRQTMPGDAEDGAPIVDLLHSRFPFEEREGRERRTLRRFGKPNEAERPTTAVLVATQIIEQSLDIDFDLMVSELPPIDLLFQRAGRLHRHARGLRPTGEMPTIGLIETPPTADGTPDFTKAYVYDKHILFRTWMALRGRSELVVPDDMRPLIESVYAEPGSPPGGAVLRALWEETAASLQVGRKKSTDEAESRYLPHPASGSRLDALTAMGRDEDDDLHPFFRALTRLTERTVTVVCLFGRPDDLYLDRGCTRPLSLAEKVTMARAAEILRRSCSIGDKRVVKELEAKAVPPVWRKAALLRNCRPIIFDDDSCYVVNRWRLRLCRETGLRVEESTRGKIQPDS